MIEKDKIRRGLSARRAVESYQVQRDIVIPAGTILRGVGDHVFAAQIGSVGKFSINAEHRADVPDNFKRVIA